MADTRLGSTPAPGSPSVGKRGRRHDGPGETVKIAVFDLIMGKRAMSLAPPETPAEDSSVRAASPHPSARAVNPSEGLPISTPYQRLGGEPALRALVDHFYRYMDTLPEAATIRAMHAPDLSEARDKLFKFLSGWLGGPDLYWEEYGHPRLRMRHLPFPIGYRERDQWMLCMQRALADLDLSPALRQGLLGAFGRTADHMVNRAEGPTADAHPDRNDPL